MKEQESNPDKDFPVTVFNKSNSLTEMTVSPIHALPTDNNSCQKV